jgi:hypothetical protein
MFPMLVEGAALVVDHRAREHAFGEVIVFIEGNMLVAHRIVGRDASNAYVTKGDALLHFDRHAVREDLIVGRVVALRRDGLEVPFAEGWRGLAHPLFGAFSRLIGDLNRAARPLREWQLSTGGRLPAGLPGPTRVLRRVNRIAVTLAARLISPARRFRAGPSGPGSATPRDGSDAPGGHP